MPVGNKANLTTIVVYGTHLDIHTKIQTELRGVATIAELFSVNIVRRAVGNNYMAVITYEAQ